MYEREKSVQQFNITLKIRQGLKALTSRIQLQKQQQQQQTSIIPPVGSGEGSVYAHLTSIL